MKKFLKYGLYFVGGLIGLVLIAVGIISATFNPNDYKQKVIDLVQEKKERTLKLDGDIKLAFWPKIGADLGKISISEHKNSKEFASVNGVKVSLALLPLLKKELVVDTVYIDGAQANIVKYKDGTTNFDDLMSKEEESQDIKFDIDGVNVTNSAVSYSDEGTGAKYSISKFNLKTGHVALAEPVDVTTDFTINSNQPEISANANIKGTFLVDPETKHFVAKGLDAAIKGDLLGGKNVDIVLSGDVDAKPESREFLVDSLKLVGSGQFNDAKLSIELNAPKLNAQKDEVTSKKTTVTLIQEKAGDTFKANLELADIKGSPKALESSGITGDIAAVQGKRTVTGKFSSPFSGNLESLIFDLPKLAGNLDIKDPSLPNGGMKGLFNLSAHTDIKNELANSKFSLNIDETKLNGDVAVTSFKKPSIKFNLNADKLNLNKLLAKSSESKAPSSGKPADLSAMKNLLLDGKLNVGSIQYEKFQISGLNVAIKADGEKLTLSGLNVKVDDSQIKGNFGISHFAKPLYTFDLAIDQLDVDKYASTSKTDSKASRDSKPLDLSALKALNADGNLRIGSLKYGKTRASNIRIDLKADGQKLNLNPVAAKIDDSQVNANVGISRFNDPIYSFNVNIDKLDADRYITKGNSTTKSEGDAHIDLSALKKLNASGEAKIGWLKLANVKTENVNLGLKAEGGVATLSPFSADLYQGSMSGLLKVDARSTPSIAFKQNMKNVSIGPLLVDSINNDMLSGKGAVNVDVTTAGNTVGALKKALSGNSSLSLTDGALKGVDIAGSVRELKNKVNILKTKDANADKSKKTDFSELTASFTIKNGVAHNEDLAMKAPILRLAKGDSRGDIDIGNETINYLAKPTIVKSLKGQQGADLDALAGFAIPLKITGTFSSPKYGMDLAAVGAALAKSNLLDKVGGDKGTAVKELLGDGNKVDALSDLLGKKKTTETTTAPTTGDTPAKPAEAPKSAEDQAKDKLKKLLKF
ncbi:MAG: AsmA family protein [Methylotenera sp.]|uniref:AsmA family protein n=1 Tax=Methylotenera sp. TaxID=2051956 RepID=UPI0024892B24|nr:AsmA family protein [Methylotenera sp.]MDI1308898.1 AsmA family protein [Methylotenera sp.]